MYTVYQIHYLLLITDYSLLHLSLIIGFKLLVMCLS